EKKTEASTRSLTRLILLGEEVSCRPARCPTKLDTVDEETREKSIFHPSTVTEVCFSTSNYKTGY
ncbi:hypothetical protein KFY46_26615, partial [Salmonella enterica subsp. enterica serovar 1,4,[5],12:i:-]|nr:hypothetical protein [Salmonella enterica subsp. enterica serovar 1,4,[5],12:i:-]